jgi:hypothetical protein
MSARRRTGVARRQVVLDEECIEWLAKVWPGMSPNKAIRGLMANAKAPFFDPVPIATTDGDLTAAGREMIKFANQDVAALVESVPGPEGGDGTGGPTLAAAEDEVAGALADPPKEDSDAGPDL